MLNEFVRAITLLLLLMGSAVGSNANGWALQILSFNDFHGNLEMPLGSDARMSKTEDPLQHDLGGSEYLSTTLSILRKKALYSITASAGDLIGATPMISGMFHDEPTVEAMEALKLDVSSVGNHEFDEGLTELLRMQKGGCHPVDGCYFANQPYDGANFSWLAANVQYTATHKEVLPPTWIKRVAGVDIGFIGMTLSGTPTLVPRMASKIFALKMRSELLTERSRTFTKRRCAPSFCLFMKAGRKPGATTVARVYPGPFLN